MLAIVFVLCVVSFITNREQVSGDDLMSNNQKNMENFAKIEVEADQLKDKVGEDDFYSEFYKGVEERKSLGVSEAKAIDMSRDKYLEREALCWYAVNHGIQLSEDQVNDRIKEAISYGKTAENYEEIQQILKKSGTTYEESMWANKERTKHNYVANDLYEKVYAEFIKGKTELDEELQQQWKIYWNDYQEKIIGEYKKTKDYLVMENALNDSEKLIKKDVADVEKVKGANISLYDKLSYK